MPPLPRSWRIENFLRHLRDVMSVAETGAISKSSVLIHKVPSAIARSIAELERGLGVLLFERNAVAHVLLGGRQLSLLIALSETRSLSAAAARIGLSQAGASMALARMEAMLGEPLFQRMMQGMMPTDTGAKLVSRGKRIIAELRHMQSDVAAITGVVMGEITIGALPLGRTYILPRAIASALRLFPKIRVTTVESPYETLVSGLRDGDVDFIVGALRPNERGTGLITEGLFDDRLGIVVRAGHPFLDRTMALEDLLAQPWILPRPGAPGRRLVDQSFRDLGIAPPIPSVETGDLAILRGLLSSSDMLTAISPHQLRHEIASGVLTELPVGLGKTVRRIGITIRQGALLSPAAQAVLGEIRTVAGNLPPMSARL